MAKKNKRKFDGAIRKLAYTNKYADAYWDFIKYKDTFKLFCSVTPLSPKREPIRWCDIIEDFNSQEEVIEQFEIHFTEKEIKELKEILDKKFNKWFKRK